MKLPSSKKTLIYSGIIAGTVQDQGSTTCTWAGAGKVVDSIKVKSE